MSENTIRIICPKCGNTKENRVKELFQQIEIWCYSDTLLSLFNEFGIHIDPDHDLKAHIDIIHEHASDLWDFRKKTTSGQRWDVDDSPEIKEKKEIILNAADVLGLTDITDPVTKPDYILPLGGARMTNYLRPKMSRSLIDDHNWNGLSVVALSTYRPKAEIDAPYYEKYAPDAANEYDAMCRGLEKTFDIPADYDEEISGGDLLYACSTIRKYKNKYKNCTISALSAPSPEPEKRWANSRDAYKFFLKQFSVKPGCRILLNTSCIYVPSQFLRFLDLAIDNGFEADCVGVSAKIQGSSFSKPSNYLQEIKSTIDSIYSLSCRYL